LCSFRARDCWAGAEGRPPQQQHQRDRQQEHQRHQPEHIAVGQQCRLAIHLQAEQLQGLIRVCSSLAGHPSGPLQPGVELQQTLLQQRVGAGQVLHQLRAMHGALVIEHHGEHGDAEGAAQLAHQVEEPTAGAHIGFGQRTEGRQAQG